MAGRYTIEFLPSAVRELEALPREAKGRVGDAIEALADEPRSGACWAASVEARNDGESAMAASAPITRPAVPYNPR